MRNIFEQNRKCVKITNRKERLDKLRKYISERLEKDESIDVRKFVATFSIDNDISPRTVKDYIHTLRDAEIIYIERGPTGFETIYSARMLEEAKKQRKQDEKSINDTLKEYDKLFKKIVAHESESGK